MSSQNENENPNGQKPGLNSSSNHGPGKSSPNSSGGSNRQQLNPIIPMSRVKTIMKSSPDIVNINPDTLYIVCKATVSQDWSSPAQVDHQEVHL